MTGCSRSADDPKPFVPKLPRHPWPSLESLECPEGGRIEKPVTFGPGDAAKCRINKGCIIKVPDWTQSSSVQSASNASVPKQPSPVRALPGRCGHMPLWKKLEEHCFFGHFFFFFWKIVPDQKKRYGEYAGTVRSAGELILG